MRRLSAPVAAKGRHPARDSSRSRESVALACLSARDGDSQASAAATTDTDVTDTGLSAIMAGRIPAGPHGVMAEIYGPA